MEMEMNSTKKSDAYAKKCARRNKMTDKMQRKNVKKPRATKNGNN